MSASIGQWICQYTDDRGVVTTDGVRAANDDWQNDQLTTDRLRRVIEGWQEWNDVGEEAAISECVGSTGGGISVSLNSISSPSPGVVDVIYTATNTASVEVDETVEITVGGVLENTDSVEIPAGESQKRRVTISGVEPGDVEVCVTP